jgi:hypothetical protein
MTRSGDQHHGGSLDKTCQAVRTRLTLFSTNLPALVLNSPQSILAVLKIAEQEHPDRHRPNAGVK